LSLVPKAVLMRSVRATLVAVPLGSVCAGLFLALVWAAQEGYIGALRDTLFVGALVAFGGAVVGLLPALAYGAVVHAFLMTQRWASYASALLVGVLPGLVWMPFDFGGGCLALVFGAPIALLTHWRVTRSFALSDDLTARR
jgi:hypothetical protein